MGVLRKPVISGNHGDFIGFFVPKKLGEFVLGIVPKGIFSAIISTLQILYYVV